MKFKSQLILIIGLLLGLTACSDDHEKISYNPEDAISSELQPIGDSYILDKEQENAVVETFHWGKMEFGYSAAVQYLLEVDLAGKNFANSQEVSATSALSMEVTTDALNKAMLQLQAIYGFVHGTEQVVEFRIAGTISKSVESVYTNSIEAKVTPYFNYSKVWIIGGYCGWKHDQSQFLYGFNTATPDHFEGWIDFKGKAQESFKITDAPNWNAGNWGLTKGVTPAMEADELTLDGGENIGVYSKLFYRFSCESKGVVLKKLASMESFGLLGTALNEELEMEFDEDTQSFYLDKVTLKEGDIRFRADKKEGELSYGMGKKEGSLAQGQTPIQVTAGTYKVVVYINNPYDLRYQLEATE